MQESTRSHSGKFPEVDGGLTLAILTECVGENPIGRVCSLAYGMVQQKFIDSRVSVRVPLKLTLEIEGEDFKCEGETVLVNQHGALITASAPLQPGSRIWINVYITCKRCAARIIYRSQTEPNQYGVKLETSGSIWGVSLTPTAR